MPSLRRLLRRSRSNGDAIWKRDEGFESLLPSEETSGIASVWPGNANHGSSMFGELTHGREYVSPFDQNKLFALGRERNAETSPFEMTEYSVPTKEVCNKVFAAAWIDDNHAVLGTKDNKLLKLNMKNRKDIDLSEVSLPRVSGIPSTGPAAASSCGMHTAAVSWDRNMLACGGDRVQDISLFDTSDADNIQPLAVLRGHSDWVFAADWCQRGTLVTGGKDQQIMLWNVDRVAAAPQFDTISSSPIVDEVQPAAMWQTSELIRDLKVHPNSGQAMVALSNTGTVSVWDLSRGSMGGKTFSTTVRPGKEAVVLDVQSGSGLIAVGSQKHIHLVDPRAPSLEQKLNSVDGGWGVRSLSWNEHVLAIGGGLGRLSFYDMRAQKYIRDPSDVGKKFRTVGEEGYLRKDDVYHSVFRQNSLPTPNAVYALARSPTGHEFLAAGGPTPFGLFGSFISVLASW